MPEAAPAGGSAPAPTVETVDGTRPLTVAEVADSAAQHAAEARAAADTAREDLERVTEHAAGMIDGAQQALADAEEAADKADAKAAEAARAAGRDE